MIAPYFQVVPFQCSSSRSPKSLAPTAKALRDEPMAAPSNWPPWAGVGLATRLQEVPVQRRVSVLPLLRV